MIPLTQVAGVVICDPFCVCVCEGDRGRRHRASRVGGSAIHSVVSACTVDASNKMREMSEGEGQIRTDLQDFSCLG